MDYKTYSVLSFSILEEESLILAPTKFYSQYSFALTRCFTIWKTTFLTGLFAFKVT